MPFWGLLITSGTFLFPAWLARKKHKRMFSRACNILAGTSMWFHSRWLGPIGAVVDKAYVHAFAVWYGAKSVIEALRRKSVRHTLLCTTMSVPIFIYQNLVRKTDGLESRLWHMTFHVTGQICLVFYAQYFEESPNPCVVEVDGKAALETTKECPKECFDPRM